MLIRTDTPPKNGSANSKPRDVVAANDGILKAGHLIRTSQLPVSNALPERELSVEAVMKAASTILWPEPGNEQPAPFDDLNVTRAREMFLETETEAFTPPGRAQVRNREGT